jgi:hypothetical protein
MTDEATTELPDGEYAIVEILGHRTMIGRVMEVERFGTKLLSIEPIYAGELLAAALVGGSSIYQFTPCPRETAFARSPKHEWQLPDSIRAAMPPKALPAPDECTCQQYPTHCANDCLRHGLEETPEFAPAFLDAAPGSRLRDVMDDDYA